MCQLSKFVLFFLCCYWSLISGPASAQEKPYIFDSYSVNEGLSQSTVFDIMRDDQGFMWIATRDGVNRFDGYTFNEYRYKPSSLFKAGEGMGELVPRGSTGDRAVINRFDLKGYKGFLFYKDARHQLLLTHNNGISLYNKYRNSFQTLLEDTSNVDALERDNNVKYSILGEDAAAGALWVWRPAKGLYVLDDSTYAIRRIILYPQQFYKSRSLPTQVVKDAGNIWMNGGDGELFSLNTRSLKLSTYCIPGINSKSLLRNLNKDSLIIISTGHIIIFNKQRNRYTDLAVTAVNERGEPFEPAATELDQYGNVWIGGSDGILIYSIARNEVIRHITSFNTFETRSSNNVICLYRDSSDNMWVGTDGDGLKKYSPHKKVFNLYRSPYITHNMVQAVYKHDDGKLYVGLMRDGLNIYEEGGRFLERISNELYPGKFPGNDLGAICRESADYLWLHFTGMHIGLFNVQTKAFQDLTGKVTALGLPYQRAPFPFLFKRTNGELYFNYGGYLLRFEGTENGYDVKIVHNFGEELLTCYFEDFLGNQYVGTKSALYVKNSYDPRWKLITLPPGTSVKSINKNAHKDLLVATNKGLFVIDGANHIKQHYNSYDYPKLINDYMYGVLLDDKDKIWVSHNKGISQINPLTGEITTYNYEDGLQSNEFNTGAYHKSIDGELFFGGIRGVNGFYPKNFKENLSNSKVVIRRMEVLDKPYESDTAISLLKKIELPYNQNTIAIEFVPLEYTNPLKNKVQYKLEGADEDWVQAGAFRMARYTNLHPGSYTFKVRGSNNDNIWSAEATTLEIVIKIPFWQSLWFRFLLLLLLLGIAYYFSTLYLDYKIRHEKLKLEKEQAVDQERARISSDMHDDLGSGLSTIRLLSEVAKRKIKDPSQIREIERISETAGEMVDKMSEIIWAMSSANDSLANLIAYMRSFAAEFLEHAHISHQFYIPETIPNIKLSGGTRRNIYLAVKESLHNVVKHAKATEVIVEVKVHKNMTIMIKDNGKGFDQEKVRLFGNGLKNIQKRMMSVGGNADITSNNGTIVFLDIPLN
ncbi:Two component regulator propeller [Chitinophaga terrae (ex Kim and Jung 2007)]|uniref:Two component regulator propeller n=1 Tax=Chitinophaga terrae (ex Kim and Jung 2007) TaxID=408074 RepID=A0A1H3Z9I6_9BACT|nr:triple tyrosine motif-containing protein [Chitinophaga terrae (ex Kim and Jung 2007)]SEA20021.1 Two component regulator propeller [Chitinophaga terrae (ex Kim and Jung 2007)]